MQIDKHYWYYKPMTEAHTLPLCYQYRGPTHNLMKKLDIHVSTSVICMLVPYLWSNTKRIQYIITLPYSLQFNNSNMV